MISSRTTVVAGPVQLIQGGTGVISRSPILLPLKVPERERKYAGLVSIVVDLPQLLEDSGIHEDSPLEVALKGRDGRGATGELFYGDESIFQDDPIELDIQLPQGSWRLATRPRKGWPAEVPVLAAHRAAGLFLSLFAGGFILLFRERIHNRFLREREETFQLATSSADEILYEWRPKENRVLVSESLARFTGNHSPRPLSSPPWWCEDVLPEDLPHVQEQFQSALNSDDRYSIEYRIRHQQDGNCLQVWDKGRILRDSQGHWLRCLGSATDVTDIRAQEKQVLQSRKLEAVGVLAGGIAHEFNNILMGILGNHSLLEMRLKETPWATEYLKGIETATNRGAQLVKQILSYSGMHEAKRQPLDLREEVRATEQLLRATLPKRIELLVHLPSSPCLILGDPPQMHQVIMNLCTNAFQAIGENPGVIHVWIDHERISHANHRPPARKAIQCMGDYHVLHVSDTGRGISPDCQDRIYEPFFTTKERGAGTGLGLSIVHGLVERHEGFITIHSKPDHGTEFQIHLKALPEVAGSLPITPPSQETKPAGRNLATHVLLVDDEPGITAILREHLEAEGMHPIVFNDPIASWNWFRQHPQAVEVVVTDLSMPNMDGLQLLEKIHSICPHLPVILVSGNVSSVSSQPSFLKSFHRIIEKPCHPLKLIQAIREAAAIRRED